jgi:hypothetical protein
MQGQRSIVLRRNPRQMGVLIQHGIQHLFQSRGRNNWRLDEFGVMQGRSRWGRVDVVIPERVDTQSVDDFVHGLRDPHFISREHTIEQQ